MRLFVVLSVLGLAAAATLPNSYLPPSHRAQSAGGSNFLQAPSSPSGGHHSAGGYAQQAQVGQSQGAHSLRTQSQGSYSQQGSQQQGQGQAYQAQGQQQYRPTEPPIPILRYENVNNGDGSYHFDYATGNGIMHQEQGHLNNPGSENAEQVVAGEYSYTGDDGQQYSVQYKADAGGFQPVGAHLPTSVPLPQEYYEAIARNEAIAAERGQSYDQREEDSDNGQYREAASHSAGGYSQGQGYGQAGQQSYQQGGHSAPQTSYSAQGSFASSGPANQYQAPAAAHVTGGRQSGSFSAQSGYHY